MNILGIWDGHDSGAALLSDGKIVFASNEERYTKRKLEVSFPKNSIRHALAYAGIKPSDIDVVAFPTTELTKTASRIFPSQKESYYAFRRRKMLKPRTDSIRHYAKYLMTLVGPLPGCAFASKHMIISELRSLGFYNPRIMSVDHHRAHASTAAFTSGFRKQIVITMDGIGDGVSGSVSLMEDGELKLMKKIPGRDSIGIFYEQVTNIIGMRELEDEGKVMAMADYSFPFAFSDNKLRDLFSVEGSTIRARLGPARQYDYLCRLAWGMPREQFAYMAQQELEHCLSEFVSNTISEYRLGDASFAGGVMSNIKANMRIRNLGNLRKWHIFPHMGDGGIALGAAMYANYELNGTCSYEFNDAYLGDYYTDDDIRKVLRRTKGIRYHEEKDRAGHAAEIIAQEDYVMWFQGRMEYGPRALGNRSIVGNASSETVKDKLNMSVKQREWYQPFAPSMLEEDSRHLLKDADSVDRFMTMGYLARESAREAMKSVVHVDMTARPQMVGRENLDYRNLINRVKRHSGHGVVLNTSFNLHGMPIVESPDDAISTLKKTNSKYLFIGGYFVENTESRA